jgi:serine/threonine-protein kinase
VCAVVDRSLAFMKPYRYPDAETMRGDVRAVRRGAPPPYVVAVAGGRIAAGAPPPIEPTRAGADPPKARARPLPEPTRIDPEPVGPTLPDPTPLGPTQVGPTLSDPNRRQFRVLALTIATLALVAGVSAGIGLATCHGEASSDASPPASASGSAPAPASAIPADDGRIHPAPAPPAPPAPAKKPHTSK